MYAASTAGEKWSRQWEINTHTISYQFWDTEWDKSEATVNDQEQNLWIWFTNTWAIVWNQSIVLTLLWTMLFPFFIQYFFSSLGSEQCTVSTGLSWSATPLSKFLGHLAVQECATRMDVLEEARLFLFVHDFDAFRLCQAVSLRMFVWARKHLELLPAVIATGFFGFWLGWYVLWASPSRHDCSFAFATPQAAPSLEYWSFWHQSQRLLRKPRIVDKTWQV